MADSYWVITHKRQRVIAHLQKRAMNRIFITMKQTFADAFRAHLERSDLKVTDVALRSGVNKDALYALKRGTTRNMAVDDAIRVAKAFGMSVEVFMGLQPAPVRSHLATQVDQLSDREAQVLAASLDALLAARTSPPSEEG